MTGLACWASGFRRKWPGRGFVDDRGSGVLWLLAMVLVMVLVGAVAATRGVVIVARHRAESAADLAALAAAVHAVDGAGSACALAGSIATANRTDVSHCTVDGAFATVTVTARLPGTLGRWRADATARAGPAP